MRLVPGRFPRWRVFWRTWSGTEQRLGTLPMVIVTPAVVSLFATVWAVSNPSEIERRGVVRLVPQPLVNVVMNALFGGVVGVLAVIGVVFVGVWIWYRLLVGDATWDARYGETTHEFMFFDLRCKPPVPVASSTLGAVECMVKTPGGQVMTAVGPGNVWASNPVGIRAQFHIRRELGVYSVRWYAARGQSRLQEVARGWVRFDGAGITQQRGVN
jgi:hypothetical protein